MEVLAELCQLSADIRLGQLLTHLGFLGEDQTQRSLWDIDDEQPVAVLYHHRAEFDCTTRAATRAPREYGGPGTP